MNTQPQLIVDQSVITKLQQDIESGRGDQLIQTLARAYNYQNDAMFTDALNAINDLIGTRAAAPIVGV